MNNIAAVGLKSNLQNLMALGWGPVALMSLETVWLAGLTLAGLYILGWDRADRQKIKNAL
ncbi:MAG: hypothetical protein CMQ11_14765 [Gammaproteobacteria bacterium]|nr:hypothetical protein [Gammaproteobacteria bacterium]